MTWQVVEEELFDEIFDILRNGLSSYGHCIKKSLGFLGLPSLKTILIADLVNAVSIGLIINPDFSTSTVATFPWILIPAVAVPIALVLHGITFYRLRNWVPIQAPPKLPEA